jgi:hypothetical protein
MLIKYGLAVDHLDQFSTRGSNAVPDPVVETDEDSIEGQAIPEPTALAFITG